MSGSFDAAADDQPVQPESPRSATAAAAAPGSAARAAESDPALVAAFRAELDAAGGRLTFARFMELALYHPEYGYYLTAERRPGRGGDFLTAPETHPFFGLTLARQIAECWERLDRPEPFIVREYGPGIGGLAYDIIVGLSEEAPACRAALCYRLVEANPYRRDQALAAMAEVGLAGIVTAEEPPAPGSDLPPIVGVALANEVADAFPVHRLVWRRGMLQERYVVWRDSWFAEAEGPLSDPDLGGAQYRGLIAAGVTLAEGNVFDVSPAAAAWFAGVGRSLARGYAIVIDYGYVASKLYREHRLAGTLRGHYRHMVTDNPFLRVGRQDLTAHVDFTTLATAGRASGLVKAGLTTQADFLARLGLGEFLPRLQGDPATTAEEYFAARAAVVRLIDPGGMGRFGVLIMARAAPVTPPLRGLQGMSARHG